MITDFVIFSAILLGAAGLLAAIGSLQTRFEIRSYSEIVLFVCVALILTVTVTAGALIQYYYTQLLQWSSYNIHDILIGKTGIVVDNFSWVNNQLLLAVGPSIVTALVGHFIKRPFMHFLVCTLTIFIAITAEDAVIEYGFKPLPTVQFEQDVLANLSGAPFLGVIATASYFLIGQFGEAFHTTRQRILAIAAASLGVSVLIVLGFLALNRIFLLTDPTYFEAVVLPQDKNEFLWTSPAVGQPFDPLQVQRLARDTIQVSTFGGGNVSWSATKSSGQLEVGLFALNGCDVDQVDATLRKLDMARLPMKAIKNFKIEFRGALNTLLLPSSRNHRVFISAIREKGDAYFTIADRSDGGEISITEFLAKAIRLNFRPEHQYMLLAIEGLVPEKGKAWIDVDVQQDKKIDRTRMWPGAGKDRRCSILPANLAEKSEVIGSQVALVAAMNFGNVHGPDNGNGIQLSFPAPRSVGFLQTGKLVFRKSNPLEPLLAGALTMLTATGHISQVRMYGNVQTIDYTGWYTIRGDSFNVSMASDGTIKITGPIQSVHTTSGERLMRTPWELMDSGWQIFLISSILGIVGIAARFLVLHLSKLPNHNWRSWNC